ncbi:hypothetical protein EVG20_g7384 [Dentipellis fragilis]|uniref:DUF1168-domain-containing protein n=1 Tax=Dentipellis fragilis TaxID=205917 RepID=A0A4Y9YFQ5_9AGAM|nr:hypothetical protein EVG20_g7384 [Dentipellis fragilis]
MSSHSPSPVPPPSGAARHATSAVERQRSQLERLLKDPAKPAYIPPPPKEKSLRPAREMMKNVQGSSAGAGSGEFHVYKASRRREYERLKAMEDSTAKEQEIQEFEARKRQRDEEAEAKTAKNRAKRQKKKGKSKTKSGNEDEPSPSGVEVPLKKKRLISGKEVMFKAPGEEIDDGPAGPNAEPEADDETANVDNPLQQDAVGHVVADLPKITIIEDD